MKNQFFCIISVLFLLGCNDNASGFSPAGQKAKRSFHMGFTPLPYSDCQPICPANQDGSPGPISYDITFPEVQRDGDMMVNHWGEEGVPWIVALEDDISQPMPSDWCTNPDANPKYPQSLKEEWCARKAQILPHHKVYIAVTPGRDGIANLWDENSKHSPLPSPWDSFGYDNEFVINAYINYSYRLIEFFNADYFNLGIEINGLINSDYFGKFQDFLVLQAYSKAALKNHFPDVPVFVSIIGEYIAQYENGTYWNPQQRFPIADPNNPNQFYLLGDLQREGVKQLMENSDIFGLSLYPYLVDHYQNMAEIWPMFSQLRELNINDLPFAVAETGYPSEDLEYADSVLEFNEDLQSAYIGLLLYEAQVYKYEFVVNFVHRDYDMWDQNDLYDPLRIWKDTGLFHYPHFGAPKKAYQSWARYLDLEFQK